MTTIIGTMIAHFVGKSDNAITGVVISSMSLNLNHSNAIWSVLHGNMLYNTQKHAAQHHGYARN